MEARAPIKQEEPTLNGSSTPKTEPKEVGDMMCNRVCTPDCIISANARSCCSYEWHGRRILANAGGRTTAYYSVTTSGTRAAQKRPGKFTVGGNFGVFSSFHPITHFSKLLSPPEGHLNRFESYRKLKTTIDTHNKMEKVAAQEIAILRDEVARLTRDREDFQAKVVVCFKEVMLDLWSLMSLKGRKQRQDSRDENDD